MPAVTVKYRGSLDLPIYTLATPNFTGNWSFQNTSFYSFAAQSFENTVSKQIVGLKGTAFDAIYGVTNIQFGTQVGTLVNTDQFSWYNNKLTGILQLVGDSIGGNPIYYSINNLSRYIGNNTTIIDVFTPSILTTLPNPGSGNTRYPQPNAGEPTPTFDFGGTVFLNISLNRRVGHYVEGGGFVLDPLNTGLIPPWSSAASGHGLIPYNGTHWILNGASNVNTTYVWSVDYVNPPIAYQATYDSPDGILNFNSLMVNNVVQPSFTKSVYGWLYCSLNAITVAGVNYAGYGVLIAPDFSWYKLIRILPQDAGSSTWRTGTVGTPTLKMDQNNFLFLKTANVQNKIYYGPIQPQITSFAFGSGIPIASLPHNPGMFK